MKLSQRRRRNMIIFLCLVLLLMAVGFSVFNNQLTINGISNITSNWNIEITDIEKYASTTGASDVTGYPTYDNSSGLSATFNTNLTAPGDYATYKIKVENLGNLNAVISNMNLSFSFFTKCCKII